VRLRYGLALAIALGGLIAFAPAASGAHVPPSVAFLFSRAQPTAGRSFTAVTINVYADGVSVSCGKAFVGKTRLVQRVEAVRLLDGYEQTLCSWRVPRGTSGQLLRVVGVQASRSDWQSAKRPDTPSWRIRPHR